MKETILIIEDDADLLELISEKVQECGYNTVCMISAENASDWLNENTPYLILLDYNLPDMNGKEFIAELKTKDKPVPPFLMSTGQGDERIAVDMMKLGARDYIIKDGNFLELIPLVISKVCKEIEIENKIQLVEKALIESNQFNKQIIECAQEGIVVIDKNLNYLTWNPFMENLTGIKALELLGKNLIVVSPYLESVGVLRNIENALQGMVVPEIESNFYFPLSQQSGWLLYSTSTLLNIENEIIGAILTVRNITERKITEQKLNESREAFKDLFNHAPVGYHEIDAEGRVVLMNQTELDMLGYIIEEQQGRCIWENSANESESLKNTKEKLRGINIPSKPFGRYFRRKDGSTFPVSVQDRIIRDNDGSIIGIRSTVQDITERKQTEEALRESEEKYRYLFAYNPQPMYIFDVETLFFVEVNDAAIKHYGYSKEEFLRMTIKDIRPKEDIFALLLDVQDTTKPFKLAGEWRHIKKNGEIINVDITKVSVKSNGRDATHVMVQDITERKKTEDALRVSEDKYRTMIENSNDLIWMLDLDGNFTFANEMSINTTGFIQEEWIGKSFVPLVFPEDLVMIEDIFQKSIAGENCNYELQLKKADQSILILSVNTSPIYIDGNVTGTVSFGRNITDRRLAEDALRESEEVYRNLVQRIPDGVYKSTRDGKFVDVNPAMVQMLGYDNKEELLELDIRSQLYFDAADRESLVLREVHEEVGVFQLRKKDGTGIWIEDHGWYNIDENGNILFHEGILRDITERKLAEQVLAEKMEQLLRFHNLTVDRELTMIELKKEINRMLINAGQPKKYRIVE